MSVLRKIKKKTGGFYYELDFYWQGKRFRKSTKTDDFQTAKIIKKDVDAKISKGVFNIEDVSTKKTIFLKEYIPKLLEYSKTHKSKETWLRDKLVINHLYKFCGNCLLNTITKEKIDAYIIKRSKEVNPSTVNTELRHIKAMMTKAIDWSYIEKNPVVGIKPISIPQSPPKFFTEKQLYEITEAIDFVPLKEIVIFSANTGLRLDEIMNVKWSDFNMIEKTVRISNKTDFHTKNKRERTLPLNEVVLLLLNNIERKCEYIFCTLTGGKRDKHFITRKFTRVLRQLEYGKEYTFHSLRHTFASNLAQKGVSLYIIKELLGHSSITTTEIYVYLMPEKYHNVVNQLNFGKNTELKTRNFQPTNNRLKVIKTPIKTSKKIQIESV